jgi:acetolactate synthase-1/3 small subunit
MSQMTLVTRGDDQLIEQIMKQLNKLIDVVKVIDLETSDYVGREMALIKVNVDEARRSEVLSIADIFRGKVVDISPHYYTIEVTGDEDKIKAIIELFKPLGIKEIARTGKAALQRESKERKA